MLRFLAANLAFSASFLLVATFELACAQDAVKLRIGVWNMIWLSGFAHGDKQRDAQTDLSWPAVAKHYIDHMGADVVAVLDVDRVETTARLFDPRIYDVHMTSDPAVPRTGFAIRKGLRFERHPDGATFSPSPHRKQLELRGADITLHLGDRKIRMLAVRLTAGCDERNSHDSADNCVLLRRQAVAIAGWMMTRVQTLTPFILFIHFERTLDDDSEVWRIMNMGGSSRLVRSNTGRMVPCRDGTPGSTAQVIFGGDARNWLAQRDLEMIAGPGRNKLVADHCPRSIDLSVR